MPGAPDTTTAKILETMARIGPHDVKTIAEIAQVGRSTVNRKVNQWLTDGTVARIDRGDEPAHWTLTTPAAITANDIAAEVPVTGPDPTDDSAAMGSTVQEGTADATEATLTEPADTTTPPVEPPLDSPDGPTSTTSDGENTTTAPQPEDTAAAAPGEPAAGTTPEADPQPAQRKRRENGAIETMGLAILSENPETAYTPGELARLAEQRELADGVAPAQAKVAVGAMINAMNKAANLGKCVRAVDKPAKYQAARP